MNVSFAVCCEKLLLNIDSFYASSDMNHAIRLSSFVKGGIYQAITSLTAFEGRLLNRWHDSYRKKHKNSNPRYGQISLTLEDVKGDDVVEVIHHKSLQNFYNYIHYDPQRGKSKRYLDAFMGVWKHAD